ncbi:hypothetical protein NECAME_01942 [Necator americanus]|uniref:Mos1 transposase HTH domain-containing protein n=1 Tax=Necator americanus TaxID=51031 RepID=W2TNR4_NECAM|nr:hypothetical protein NECAME_01942 [Necator americanus]ETN82657.1 hypothetical protein NECAME_01942 [Necator americanus]
MRNIIKAWGDGTASGRATRRLCGKFRNSDFGLENEEGPGPCGPSEVDNDQLRAMIDMRKATQDVPEELNVDRSTVFRHLKQIGNVKKLDKWIPHD